MKERNLSNHSLFERKEQMEAVNKHNDVVKAMASVKNVKEWNDMRVMQLRVFKGGIAERLMVFGYIDGIIGPEIFGKKKLVS